MVSRRGFQPQSPEIDLRKTFARHNQGELGKMKRSQASGTQGKSQLKLLCACCGDVVGGSKTRRRGLVIAKRPSPWALEMWCHKAVIGRLGNGTGRPVKEECMMGVEVSCRRKEKRLERELETSKRRSR